MIVIELNPKYEALRAWIEAIPQTFAESGDVIYDARNQIRLITAPDGLRVCVKRFHRPAFFNRIAYSFLRPPKAVRAYQNALCLLQEGIATPEPIAYILCGNGLLTESFLITKESTLTRNFYEFRHHPLAGYEPIVEAFAQFTAEMHQKGVLHKDYSPGNILFDIDKNGRAQFEIVDINRLLFHQTITQRTACYNFRKLWGNEDFFVLLATSYARARHWDEATCCRLTLTYWRRFWRFRK